MHTRIFASLGLMALLAIPPAAVCAADAQQRVVFQVNEDDSRKWNTILGNINNVQEELGRVEVTVVAIGPGLGMLKAEALTANELSLQGSEKHTKAERTAFVDGALAALGAGA